MWSVGSGAFFVFIYQKGTDAYIRDGPGGEKN